VRQCVQQRGSNQWWCARTWCAPLWVLGLACQRKRAWVRAQPAIRLSPPLGLCCAATELQ
jgi:hypothetical protein